MWNQDETGGTPGRDTNGNSRRRRYLTRSSHKNCQIPEWERTNRATLLVAISGDADTGPPLFLFKGKRIVYRQLIQNGDIVLQTYAHFLPRDARIAHREEGVGIDSVKFYAWAV